MPILAGVRVVPRSDKQAVVTYAKQQYQNKICMITCFIAIDVPSNQSIQIDGPPRSAGSIL